MVKLWKRIRFGLSLTDADLEDINYMCDWFLANRTCSAMFSERLNHIHDLTVDASHG